MNSQWFSKTTLFRGYVVFLSLAGGLLLLLPWSVASSSPDQPLDVSERSENETPLSPSYGAESNPTGNPIGGGPGYSDIIDPSQADYTVTNKTELLFALGDAQTNIKDSWGSNNGTIYGAAWVDGKTGKAFHFDGVDNYVEIGEHPSLNITGTMTIETWARFDALTAHENLVNNNLYRIYHRGDWAGDHIYFLFRIEQVASPGDSAWDNWAGVRTEAELVAGQWVHLVGVKDGNRMRIYLNGVEKELDCLSGYTLDGSQTENLHLGQSPFNGTLDDVKVYNRALTTAQVQQNYAGASIVTDGLVSRWQFEEDPTLTRKIVYVADDAEIDLTGEQGIAIPISVSLASGRGRNGSPGGLIYTDLYTEVMPLLEASGPGVRITGLRLRGPDPEIGDHSYGSDDILSRGFQSRYPFEVDNSEWWGWSHTAMMVDRGNTNAYIHHNYIHHNRRTGLGYGVCLGYSNVDEPISALIEANLFDFNRHSIAATGNAYSSYKARYNIALEHANGSVFDRHGTADPGNWVGGDAGDWTIVHDNTVRVTDVYAVGIRGKPLQGAEIYDNWFYPPDLESAIYVYTTTNVTIGDNHYGVTPPAGSVLPVAKASALPAFGKVPLTVSFDGSSSYDPDGALVAYQWDFGDGNIASGVQVTHTFNTAGKYNVTLTVSDNEGIPTRARIPVMVAPASGSYVLDFWVKDSYRGFLAGYYHKQVLIDETVVWQDDVAGDKGWTHVVTDVTAYVTGKDQVTLTLRTYCETPVTNPDTQIIEVFAYWDDVNLSGGHILNGDMESSDGWSYSKAGDPEWRGFYSSGDVRSGDRAYTLYHPYRTNSIAGSWAEIEQAVTIISSTLRGQWRFEQIAGNFTPDGSMYSNHGTLVNMGDSSWVEGIIGWALSFDGVDDYVDGGSDLSLKSPVGTIELWIKPQTAGNLDILRLFEDKDQNYFSLAKDDAGRIGVLIADDGLVHIDLTSTVAITDTRYHHVAITQDGSGVKIFIDGKESSANGANSAYWSSHLTLGCLQIGRGNHGYFNGMLDNVAIYARALSGGEIYQHYAKGYPRGQWRLDEGAGSTAADSSIYGNHGTLVNMGANNWVDGVSNRALCFDGIDDYVDLGAHPSLNITDTLTIEMWVRFDAFATNENLVGNNLYRINHRGDWAGDRIYFLYRVAESASPGDSAWDNWAGARTETELVLGRWHHIVGVKAGNRMSIYLDGALEKEFNCLSGYTVDNSQIDPLFFGQSPFSGALDEITLYPRALTADEVQQRHKQGRINVRIFLPTVARPSQ